MPNRLAQESSPYLLQHKNNPVDWYPWGEEALARARAENKPILLSVGYSACHWCHVMEHESFENPEIARLMNENYVSIKVDREERPDLDQIYQNVAQAMTRSGGWPLTVFLTPDLKPFFGGTYYPPEDRYGRPGFPRVLEALAEAFRNEPESIAENARRLTEVIQSLENQGRAENPALPTPEALGEAAAQLVGLMDWQNGGFGGVPKFPNPMMLDFLARTGSDSGDPRILQAVRLTLERMATGGIYDQLGGGFHRYSVDESWSVPHFEKMLYDNGLLLRTYAQAVLSGETADGLFPKVLRETVDYLLREMAGEGGAFFAAQDADSEGEEGKYFVWDLKDLQALLTEEEARAFALRFGVTERGNFEHGKTVLFLDRSIEEVAKELGRSSSEIVPILDRAGAKLLAARAKRVAPGTDHKILAGWNGLAISGLSWAAQALAGAGDTSSAKRASDAARRAFGFLSAKLERPDGRLFSTYQAGAPKLNAYLDDYAFLAMAALDLARFENDAVAQARYLDRAETWIETVLKHFRDPAAGGYFFTSDDHEELIQRPKTVYDQAIPSGTGVALQCLAALSEMDRRGRGAEYWTELEKELASVFPPTLRNAFGYGELFNAAWLYLKGPIVVSGQGSERALDHPRIFRKAPDASQGNAALVCHRRTCGLPLKTEKELKSALEKALKN